MCWAWLAAVLHMQFLYLHPQSVYNLWPKTSSPEREDLARGETLTRRRVGNMKGLSMRIAIQLVSSTQLRFFHPSGFQLGDVSAPRALPGLQRVLPAVGQPRRAEPAVLHWRSGGLLSLTRDLIKKILKNASRCRKPRINRGHGKGCWCATDLLTSACLQDGGAAERGGGPAGSERGTSVAAAGPSSGCNTDAALTRVVKAWGLSSQPVGCTRPYPS